MVRRVSPPPRRVLAFDPGQHETGWAVIDAERGPGRARFIDGGKIPSTFQDARDLLVRLHAPPLSLVAVEWVEIAFAKSGGLQALIATAAVAGMLDCVAQFLDKRVVRLPAVMWRHQVCGNPSAKDALIKSVLPVLVDGLPKTSNAHVRDAIGCALAAARQ